MKKMYIYIILFFITISFAYSQKLTLEKCYELAVQKSPITKQKELYTKSSGLEIDKLSSIYYPQVKLQASATYQSDVFKFPFSIPMFDIPTPPNDQYQASIQVNQLIYEGGFVSNSIESQQNAKKSNLSNVEINLRNLKEIITNFYFSALSLQETEKIYNTVLSNLENRMNQIESLVSNGVVLKSSKDALKIEILKTKQNIYKVQMDKNTVLKNLSEFLEIEDIENNELEIPKLIENFDKNISKRPEFDLFNAQKDYFASNRNAVNSQLLPTLSFFAKGGVGKPNPFNFMDTDFKFFYILGLNLQWTLWDWNSVSNSKEVLEINQEIVQTQEENFEKNLNITLYKEINDFEKYNELIKKDEEIIKLQQNIVDVSFSQFKNGEITSTEYLQELNILTQSRINLELHKIQKINSVANWMVKSGN